MADLNMADPRNLGGAALPFRFDVTWRSLTGPPGASAAAAVLKPARIGPPAETEAKEWEMVLPRMRRPAALATVPEAQATPAIPVDAPRFATAPERSSRRWIFLAAGALALALAFVAYRSTAEVSAPETAVKATEMGGAGWVTEWASDATGSSRGRQISL